MRSLAVLSSWQPVGQGSRMALPISQKSKLMARDSRELSSGHVALWGQGDAALSQMDREQVDLAVLRVRPD